MNQKYSKTEAEKIVAQMTDENADAADDEELDALFAAIYGREPDDNDRQEGIWSLLCAAVPAND